MKYTKEFEEYWKKEFGYEQAIMEQDMYNGMFDDRKEIVFKTWQSSREQAEKVIDEALKIFEGISRNKYYYNSGGYYCGWVEIVVKKFINENTKTKSIGLWKNTPIEELDKEQLLEVIKFVIDNPKFLDTMKSI